MQVRAVKKIMDKHIGFTVETRSLIWPFWKTFHYGVNDGGGKFYILESTEQLAVNTYLEKTGIYDLTVRTGDTTCE